LRQAGIWGVRGHHAPGGAWGSAPHDSLPFSNCPPRRYGRVLVMLVNIAYTDGKVVF